MRIKATRWKSPRAIKDERDLLKLWLMTMAALVLAAIAKGAEPGPSLDTAAVLRVTTRFGLAHACPISATLALTSAHVIDPAPLNSQAPLFGGRWSDGYFGRGRISPIPGLLDSSRDLAVVRGEFERHYVLAAAQPAPGSALYALGYDFRNTRDPLGSRLHALTLVRQLGGVLVMNGPNTEGGSSGGCVFNAANEVVGIIDGSIEMDNEKKVVMAVAVWGEVFEEPVLEIGAPLRFPPTDSTRGAR